MAHILVVEDDADINRILCRYLEKENYETTAAFSGSEAKLLLSVKSFDLILLDLMLPGINGEELVADIRKSSFVPIMIISAKSALEDRVKLLKSGADDYLVKPFEREEVLARVDALLRRSRDFAVKIPDKNEISFKQLTMRPVSREVFVKGNLIGLTSHEYEILNLLLKYPERVFTKEQLYQDIWKSGYYGEDNTINVHISNIRKKIKDFDEDSYIKTVWGIGFKLDTAL
ncbi:response regulator transcription factor [Clostridium sp. KNHs205]|uniref:response regulator transcription factor n=1 Tax=Clostridium sp. KNHs205 TaxID=1449050 RepID=UPI00051C8726|nr:response regulator transcription factor [Clostridium sp. KNHs205]